MTDERVYKGLAHVRPRPGANFKPGVTGAYVNVLVLGHDATHRSELVADALDDYDCELLDVDLEPLETALDDKEAAGEWREIAKKLNDTQQVWCAGTFHTYSNDDDDA